MQLRAWFVVCIFTVCTFGGRLNNVQAQTTVRPYQFGFTIEEQQHRSEKRDERGIVMGEFGFITADGIYHVTVYATDEEGRFRILAMRSYPYESPPKTIDMVVVPKKRPTTPANVPIATTKKPLPTFQYTNDACSGCSLPKKPTQTPATAVGKKDPKSFIRPLSKDIADVLSTRIPGKAAGALPTKFGGAGVIPPGNKPRPVAGVSPIPALNKGFGTPSGGSNANRPANTPTYLTGNSKGPKTPNVGAAGAGTKFGSGNGGVGASVGGALGGPTGPRGVAGIGGNAGNRVGGGGGGGNGGGAVNNRAGGNANANKPFGGNANANKPFGGNANANKPFGGNANANKPFGGNANGNRPFGGSNGKGSAADGGGDLYRFKYLLDYNGHTETGSRSGNKEGNYFVIDDDNVERTIEYIANEFGYQPRIRWRKLPNPVQAKENTLKDYEFVWFKNNS